VAGSSGVEEVDESREESRDCESVRASSSMEGRFSKTSWWLRCARNALVGGTDLLHANGDADKPFGFGLGGLRDCFEPGTNAGLRSIT
jgi:hypothetical protein